MFNSSELPFVSVIIPARNEAKFIGACLESFLKQNYPAHLFEVIVADGVSADKTKEIARGFQDKMNLKIIDNPRFSAPFGFNFGLEKAAGEIIIRVDAHCLVGPDFISQNVKNLLTTGAECVGGPLTTLGQGWMGEKIALALANPFCVADAKFRYAQKPEWVDTVAFGAYRREVFKKIGPLNESLIRNQDMEFSTRLISAGGRILLTPDIKISYFCRSNLRQLAKQCFLNGLWNIKTVKIVPGSLKTRHFVPMIFSLYIILNLILAAFNPVFLHLLIFGLLLYFTGGFVFSARAAWETKNPVNFLVLPLIFFWFHFTYGVGSMFGVLGLLKRG